MYNGQNVYRINIIFKIEYSQKSIRESVSVTSSYPVLRCTSFLNFSHSYSYITLTSVLTYLQNCEINYIEGIQIQYDIARSLLEKKFY